MERVFVDTNIVIDLLQRREGFYEEAQELFTLADQKKVELFISSLTITTSHYLLAKHYNSKDARKILTKFKVLVNVLPLNDKIIELALASDFNDFEDAIQYHTALEYQIEIITTRNKKDFQKSSIPILTAGEFLKLQG
jgi:predicted nucleic acid-binding protein